MGFDESADVLHGGIVRWAIRDADFDHVECSDSEQHVVQKQRNERHSKADILESEQRLHELCLWEHAKDLGIGTFRVGSIVVVHGIHQAFDSVAQVAEGHDDSDIGRHFDVFAEAETVDSQQHQGNCAHRANEHAILKREMLR